MSIDFSLKSIDFSSPFKVKSTFCSTEKKLVPNDSDQTPSATPAGLQKPVCRPPHSPSSYSPSHFRLHFSPVLPLARSYLTWPPASPNTSMVTTPFQSLPCTLSSPCSAPPPSYLTYPPACALPFSVPTQLHFSNFSPVLPQINLILF